MPDFEVPLNLAYVHNGLDSQYRADDHGFPIDAFANGVLYYFTKGTGGSSGASNGVAISNGTNSPGPYYDEIGNLLGTTVHNGTLLLPASVDAPDKQIYGLEVSSGNGVWIDTGIDFAGSGTIIAAVKLTGNPAASGKVTLFRPAVDVPADGTAAVVAWPAIHPALTLYEDALDTTADPDLPYDDTLFYYDNSLIFGPPQIRRIAPNWRVSASQPQVIGCRWNGTSGRIETTTMVGGGFKTFTDPGLIGHWAATAPGGQNMVVGLTPTEDSGAGADRDARGEIYTFAYQPTFVTEVNLNRAMNAVAQRLYHECSVQVQGYKPEIK